MAVLIAESQKIMPSIVDRLLRDPVLSKSEHTALSRLLPYLEERNYTAGELLYRAGEPADGLFLLTSGEVQLHTPDGETHGPCYTRFGEESTTDMRNYLSDAIAVTSLTVLYIPRAGLLPLLATTPSLQTEFMFALMEQMTGNRLQIREPAAVAASKETAGVSRLIGWSAAIVLPLIALPASMQFGMERNAAIFLAIFSAAIAMWIFSLVDEYVPGLFAVLAILIAGLVPTSVMLTGFASNGFLMALSVLGLSAVIVSSGLGWRTMLLLLNRLPNTRFWHNFGLAVIGFFLTPLIPTIRARISLISPFYKSMTQNLRLTSRREAATQLAVSAFSGAGLFSAIFLTGNTLNFAVFSLLPLQLQDSFQGFKWPVASGVAALVLLAAYGLGAALLFSGEEKPRLCKERIALQLKLLGRMKHREWAALLGSAVFILGMLTASLHHISPPWLGLAILYGLLLFGSLSKKEIKEKIDWSFLLYLSGLTGMVTAYNYLELDRLLAAALPGLGIYMRDSFGLFVLMLFGVIFVIRLAVPIGATIVILGTLLIPLAEIHGVNPWVMGFVILMLSEVWFLPYQCSYYLRFRAHNHSSYHEKSFLMHNGLINLAKLAAVYASIPYWKAMGLL